VEKGIVKGAHIQALEIAKKMLEAGLNHGQVASLTGLTPEEVEQLKSESPQLNG
jgi:predicted transposase/invertase (TIGR01784 family)